MGVIFRCTYKSTDYFPSTISNTTLVRTDSASWRDVLCGNKKRKLTERYIHVPNALL